MTSWRHSSREGPAGYPVLALDGSGARTTLDAQPRHPVDTAPLQKAVTPVYQDYAKRIGGMQLVDAVIKQN